MRRKKFSLALGRGTLPLVADDKKTDRRGALQTMAAIGGVVGCGALAVPTTRFLIAPAQAGASGGLWIKTVPVAALADGEPKRVALVADRRDAWTLDKNVELGVAWLILQGTLVRAWTNVCPHLGCAVDRNANGTGFWCPCHDSFFDADGRALRGPSPRDLDALATRIEDGFVFVEFRRFRQGVPEKVAVG
jgi:cytochrome b6-f complex iron-sulfur subunit/menaquinol-cytochrome c reductase iron-sulfur subunit